MGYAAEQPVPWPVPPNWAQGVVESLQWLTDILRARSGEVQKRELRLAPRRQIQFSAAADGQARRVADALLFDQGGKLWALPVWHDVQLLTASAGLGDTEIACRTDGFEFVEGGRALLWRAVNQFELIEIVTVGTTTLSVAAPLTQAWAAGTRLYPVRDARLLADAEEGAWNDQAGARKLTFTIDEPCDWPAVLPAVTYRGYPVLEHRSDENDDPTAAYHRELDSVDADTGPVTYLDYVDAPIRRVSHQWLLQGRSEHGDFRSLLYGLRGRMGVLWLPSMAADLVLVATTASGATALEVEWAGYTLYGRQQSNRRDLRIELRNGSVLYRRIIGAIDNGDNETLTLDAAPGVALDPATVLLISFLTLSELASDACEINHVTDAGGITKAALTFQAVKHEL